MNRQKLMAELLKSDAVIVVMPSEKVEEQEEAEEVEEVKTESKDEDWPKDGYKAKLERHEKAKETQSKIGKAVREVIEDSLLV